jgi:hypothetical protein
MDVAHHCNLALWMVAEKQRSTSNHWRSVAFSAHCLFSFIATSALMLRLGIEKNRRMRLPF